MFSQRKTMSSYQQSMQRSSTSSTSSVITTKRGYKPSDRFDPSKKSFLVDLSKQIWKKRVFKTIFLVHLQKFLSQHIFDCRTRSARPRSQLICRRSSRRPPTRKKSCRARIVRVFPWNFEAFPEWCWLAYVFVACRKTVCVILILPAGLGK